MNGFLQELLQQLNEIWGRLSAKQKVLVSVIPAAMLLALVSFVVISSKPRQSVLYSNLTSEDAGLIVKKLKDDKVPYEIADGGAVMVPSEMVYELRLQMASVGLPQGGAVGFEMFEKTRMGMTDFVQQVNYRRALQGELTRTIKQLVEVEQARVHLVIPRPELFVEEEKPATASIVLKLNAFKKLDLSQIKGIVHLVASSVEGLKPEHITLIDIHGNILNEELQSNDDSKLNATQLEIQKKLEKDLEKKAEAILLKVLGPNKAVVKVTAEMDFDRSQFQKTIYAPEGTVRSEQIKKEDFEGIKETAQGIPGTESNIPGYQAVEEGTPAKYKRDENVANYEITTEQRQVVEATGDILRLTIAAIIDGKRTILKSGVEEYVPLTFEEIRKYTGIIRNATGFKESRGDQITVENIPFDVSYLAKEEKAMQDVLSQDFRNRLIRNITMVVLILGSGFLLFFAMYRREEHLDEIAIGPEHDELSLDELGLEGLGEETLASRKQEIIHSEIIKLTTASPENAAKLLKGWLAEED